MRAVKFALSMLAIVLLAGCTDHFNHDDRMTPYSGEAMAANRVAQMVDPWPASSRSPRFGTNGERMQRAMTNYKAARPPAARRLHHPQAAAPMMVNNPVTALPRPVTKLKF